MKAKGKKKSFILLYTPKGVCYSCLNSDHKNCGYKDCECRKSKHKNTPWWKEIK
jgi:hypothetical protein